MFSLLRVRGECDGSGDRRSTADMSVVAVQHLLACHNLGTHHGVLVKHVCVCCRGHPHQAGLLQPQWPRAGSSQPNGTCEWCVL
jgi:hypothetical protein